MPGFEMIDEAEEAAISEVLKDRVVFRYGFDVQRRHIFRVRHFENAFASLVGVQHGQAVSSGTAAVYAMVKALELSPGDEVITAAFNFVATAEAILAAGAIPVFANIDESLNLSPTEIERLITPRTKAVIPVHMLGAAADMNAIAALCTKHELQLAEDCAQAPGSSYQGRRLGSFGEMAAFSFDAVKTITVGEGGMIVTNSKDHWVYLSQFCDHGHVHDPGVPRGEDPHHVAGFNFRMSEIGGAMGLAQLAKLETILRNQRRTRAELVNALIDLQSHGCFAFRKCHDEAGDGADTLVLIFKEKSMASRYANNLATLGVGTKILPGATAWHFAGEWKHMLSGLPQFRNWDNAKSQWAPSLEILNRSVAIPISSVYDDKANRSMALNLLKAFKP